MPQNKISMHQAVATGRFGHDKSRFAGRMHQNKPQPVGDPPQHLGGQEHVMWNVFRDEMPWLLKSDRAALELACSLRVLVANGNAKPQDRALLRSLLGDLGGNPLKRAAVDDPQGNLFDDDDPAAAYLS